MPKIVIIGAGSVVFARRLITDFLTLPSLQDAEIALIDINPATAGDDDGVDANTPLSRRAGRHGASHLDRREALAGR